MPLAFYEAIKHVKLGEKAKMKYLFAIIMVLYLAVPVLASNHSYTRHSTRQTANTRTNTQPANINDTNTRADNPRPAKDNSTGWKVPKAHHKHKWFERHR